MAWLLEIKQNGKDLYPEIKKRAKAKQKSKHDDMVRFEILDKFDFMLQSHLNITQNIILTLLKICTQN